MRLKKDKNYLGKESRLPHISVKNFQKGSRSQNRRLQRTELRPRHLSVSCSFTSICPEVSGLQDPQLWGEVGSGHLQPLLPVLEKI